MTPLRHPKLNDLGVEALVALCRYVLQHGNVTRSSRYVARMLSAACGDYDPINHYARGAEQDRLDEVVHRLDERVRALKNDSPPAHSAPAASTPESKE